MIGSGVFSLPQNMAAGAAPLAIIIGWLISGVGILALAFVYLSLSRRKPALDAGPYAYAKAGFGPFIGFNSAWGYWLSAWIGNVSYAVVMFSALSYFFPPFGEGNTWQAIVGASAVLWLVHALILSGVQTAALVNLITTVAKIAPLVLFVVLAVVAFKFDVFTLDFTGASNLELGSILNQVRSTMLVTLWVFIGVEGASVVSGRAERRSDVGLATMVGFFVASMAGVLEYIVGPWGAILVNVTLVVSVLGAFLSWSLLAAEVPHVAGRDGTMPRFLAGENKRGAPATSLWVTNGLVQIFLIVALFANSTYTALFYIASTAILVPYVFSGAYAAKLAITGEGYRAGESRTRDLIAGLVATAYGVWLVYAAGPTYLFMAAMLYAPGIIFYVIARRENGQKSFSVLEAVLAVGLVVAGLAAAYLIWNGSISPL